MTDVAADAFVKLLLMQKLSYRLADLGDTSQG